RSIIWIPLERTTLDLLHLLYPDMEYKEYTISLAKAARRRGGRPRPTPLHSRPPTVKPRPRPPRKGVTGCGQGQPEREASGARKGGWR
ncbi:hypothetical protein GW17_00058931, partial [Ensete ventricosum]